MEDLISHSGYLKRAIKEASRGMKSGEGGPFGAVIVRNGRILSSAHNTVLVSHDPTAHAEINAIRQACAGEKDHHLTGAILYTNFEPCPMCMTAIYWADIRKIFYAAGKEEAERIGFMDSRLYRELAAEKELRDVKSAAIKLEEMSGLIAEWESLEGRIYY